MVFEKAQCARLRDWTWSRRWGGSRCYCGCWCGCSQCISSWNKVCIQRTSRLLKLMTPQRYHCKCKNRERDNLDTTHLTSWKFKRVRAISWGEVASNEVSARTLTSRAF